jgi:Inhibitor of growth proteins N-terminal histone-binding
MATTLGRRQSSRAVRSTAGRPQNYYASQHAPTVEDPTPSDQEPGFYPAITHFTDATDALPREVMRHFSMMKEVEAKLHTPDEELGKLATELSALHRSSTKHPTIGASSEQKDKDMIEQGAGSTSSPTDSTSDQSSSLRQLCYQIALMAPMLDEKIACLSTASMTLSKQLEVMESSYKYIPEEVSVEARLGSSTHWAYVAEKETKKTGHERVRREAAVNNAYAGGMGRIHDLDDGAGRSDARREGVVSRKIRNQQIDSDFEERPSSRKQHGKSRKQVDPQSASNSGLGALNGTGPNKRKKPAAAVIERSVTSALSGHKNLIGSPTLGADGGRKRKNAPGPLPGRKR